MVQHLLLIAGAVPLLLLADPFAALCSALPAPVRLRAGHLLRVGTPLRALWRGLTAVSVAWLAHVAAVWLWHLPRAYDAAVADRVVHDVEHLTVFFGTAVLFWWPIIRRRRGCGSRRAMASAWAIWCSRPCRARSSACSSR